MEITSSNQMHALLVYCVTRNRWFARLTPPIETVNPRARSMLHPEILSTSHSASHMAKQ